MKDSTITANLMTGHIGSEFAVLGDVSQATVLVLSSVVNHIKTEHNEAFSLFFHGPQAPFLPQGTRRLKHASLGELEIFLVPVARDTDGFQYEAVFNFLH